MSLKKKIEATNMDIVNIGVVGYGYWGPNIVRNFVETYGASVRWVADKRPDRCALVKNRYPGVAVTEDYEEMLNDPKVDAIVVATPVCSHHILARQALESGKHVLVEKPMAHSVQAAEELIDLADKKNLVLMVDHTFIYTGAVRRMKEILDVGELGDLYYFDSVRVNLGLFQHDNDVIWDLAPHDLSILSHIVRERPKYVSVVGATHTKNGLTDLAYLSLDFGNHFLAHFHVNWLSPVKIRQILIGGSRRMLVYDDMESSEKVRVYDRGVHITTQEGIYSSLVDYRTGDMWAPKIETKEALAFECEHFLDCVRFNKVPMSNGASGLAVVKILEAASKSLAAEGQKIPV
jgi:predicted dehydrogenase